MRNQTALIDAGATPSPEMTRRESLGAMCWPVAALAASALMQPAALGAEAPASPAPSLPPASDDESFWAAVQQSFTIDRSILNLNNGGVSPAPRSVQEAHKRHLDYANACPPPVALWRVQEPQKEGVRAQLARTWGVDPEEIALVRNASEGLQICQFGIDLKAGDEVLCTTQDYPRMLNTFKQREKREGVVLRQFSVPVPCEDPQEIVKRYEQAITSKTRALLASHVINLTGQVMPIKAICEMARAKGLPVIVDGAHAFAHIDFKLSDLGCDFYATSLHKWLFAPHGTGLLYVRRERIKDLWPLQAAPVEKQDNIRKFEEIGTHPEAANLAIAEALNFHLAIGPARKQARMTRLRKYWVDGVLSLKGAKDRVRINTPSTDGLAFGLANFRIDGVDHPKLTDYLWDKHRVLVTAIKHEEFEGIRVTPSVYTSFGELDRFVDLIGRVLEKGVPA